MYPHRIRLRGPWDCEPLARTDGGPVPPPFRVVMPCRWTDTSLGPFSGTVRCRRRFGLPRQIDAHERVWLTFGGVADRATVQLNGQPLDAPGSKSSRRAAAGPRSLAEDIAIGALTGSRSDPATLAAPFTVEITTLLRERNELIVEVESSNAASGLWGEVALEIRCTAYLDAVRVWRVPGDDGIRLHAAGVVVGSAERPLDLYVLLGGQTLAYTAISASPAGQPFELVSEPLAPDAVETAGEVGVDLINGAVKWYQWAAPVGELLREP